MFLLEEFTVTHKWVVLPLIICRFSNPDREVRLAGHDWMSRKPARDKEVDKEKHEHPENPCRRFQLDQISQPTCDLLHRFKVVQLLRVHWGDLVVGIPGEDLRTWLDIWS